MKFNCVECGTEMKQVMESEGIIEKFIFNTFPNITEFYYCTYCGIEKSTFIIPGKIKNIEIKGTITI